jgi:hypothetical protein
LFLQKGEQRTIVVTQVPTVDAGEDIFIFYWLAKSKLM